MVLVRQIEDNFASTPFYDSQQIRDCLRDSGQSEPMQLYYVDGCYEIDLCDVLKIAWQHWYS